LDIEDQLQILCTNLEIVNDLTNIQSIKNKSQDNSCICDVFDGTIYQKTLQNCKIDNAKDYIILTYNFNIDGASVFKNSKKSFWPLQIIINELSPQIRIQTYDSCRFMCFRFRTK